MAAQSETQIEWYTITCGTCTFTLPNRYQEICPIGKGASGAVIRAKDTETGQYVAIKKLLRPFHNSDRAKQTYRELKLLMYLYHPDIDIIQLYNVFTPEKNVDDFSTLYFVFNFVDYNLRQVIKGGKPFSEDHIKQIIYSLLRALKYIHSAYIIHRDLKPENIGIDRDSNVAILDFGLARIASDGIQTGYVVTRWWRAPEVFINWERYDEKLDIWSIGCIMAELIVLQPIFPGQGYLDQLDKIFDIIGTPDITTLHELATEGVDLLDRLLSFDPRQRPTAQEALAHPFLKTYHSPEDEPTANPVVDEHQDAEYSVAKWKYPMSKTISSFIYLLQMFIIVLAIVWKMVQDFVPPQFRINDNPNTIHETI
ncbi:unnamed protein product [Rotaria sp. Silwood1]|nr:unnamed protein product [Rotaria sp. Silwood1]